jgi:DNA uptake protein ComE-like DNA-binding protein
VLWTLVPFGWGNWVAFLVAGVKARHRPWILCAAAYGVGAFAPLLLVGDTADEGDTTDAIGGVVLIAVWLGGIVHAFLARPAYVHRLTGMGAQLAAARRRVATREEALELAREEPAVALEMGIGRPDRPGAADAGVVDVNGAPYEVLERLPGFDRALARRVVALREELDGFSSLEDLGMTLDLPADTVEDLRDRVVFLPR